MFLCLPVVSLSWITLYLYVYRSKAISIFRTLLIHLFIFLFVHSFPFISLLNSVFSLSLSSLLLSSLRFVSFLVLCRVYSVVVIARTYTMHCRRLKKWQLGKGHGANIFSLFDSHSNRIFSSYIRWESLLIVPYHLFFFVYMDNGNVATHTIFFCKFLINAFVFYVMKQ